VRATPPAIPKPGKPLWSGRAAKETGEITERPDGRSAVTQWRLRHVIPRDRPADGQDPKHVGYNVSGQDLQRIAELASPAYLGCGLPLADDSEDRGQDLEILERQVVDAPSGFR
jgi:hypothetical protein